MGAHDFVHWFGGLPPIDELLPLIKLIKSSWAQEVRNVKRDGGTVGQHATNMYNTKFNMCYADVQLLKTSLKGYQHASTVKSAWEVFLRKVLTPHTFFQLSQLSSDIYFYVAASKSYAYRDAVPDGEATGRKVAVCFFKQISADMDGITIGPTDDTGESLSLQLLTVAEIAATCGDHRLPPEGASLRDAETLLERRFLDHDLLRFTSSQIGGDPSTQWHFVLSEERHAEDIHFENTARDDLTKMELIRVMQQREGFSHADREAIWAKENLRKHNLLAAFDMPGAGGGIGPGAALLAGGPPAPVAPKGTTQYLDHGCSIRFQWTWVTGACDSESHNVINVLLKHVL